MRKKTAIAGASVSRRAATIADVAAAAGCSTAAVSCVLNGARGNIGVSEETRARVTAAAQRLAYRPSFASRSLVLRRTQTVGVYVPPSSGASLGFSYEAAILTGVEAACRESGYDILAVNLGGQQRPENCAHKLAERRIDGLILFHVQHDAPWVETLCQSHANVAAVNYYGPCRSLDITNFDDRRATALAVERLVQLGHRRIGYVGPLHPFGGPGEELRRAGFLEAMAGCGHAVDPAWVLDEDHPARGEALGRPEAERMPCLGRWVLSRPPNQQPTAWVAHADNVAVPLVKVLRREGVEVPRDVSVVGIDDSDICRYSEPELTSIRQPFARMGGWAAGRVIARATAADPAAAATWVRDLAAPEWVERGSVAPPGRACPRRRPAVV